MTWTPEKQAQLEALVSEREATYTDAHTRLKNLVSTAFVSLSHDSQYDLVRDMMNCAPELRDALAPFDTRVSGDLS